MTLTWRPQANPDTVTRGEQIDHISQQKLLEVLSEVGVLTVSERWHLSGCHDCARSLEFLRDLRESSAQISKGNPAGPDQAFTISTQISKGNPAGPDQAFTISTDFKSDSAS